LTDEAWPYALAAASVLPIPVDVGALVDAQWIHGSVCKQAPSKIARHQAINDVIARAITTTGVPVTKEPVGLTRLNGKRSDGLMLIQAANP